MRTSVGVADEKPEGTIFLIPARLEECAVLERLRKLHCKHSHVRARIIVNFQHALVRRSSGFVGALQISYDLAEPQFNGGGLSDWEVEFLCQGFQFRTPLTGNGHHGRELVSAALAKDLARCFCRFCVVQFAECIDQQNVQHIARPSRRERTRTSMQFLCDLIGETQTPDRRDNPDARV